MVVVDNLNKVAHFVSIKYNFKSIDVVDILWNIFSDCMVFPRPLFQTEMQNSLQISRKASLQD
jgi:hypothetical protein